MLYASDTVLIVLELKEELQYIMNEFERAWDIILLKINLSRRKLILLIKNRRASCEKVKVRDGNGGSE